MSLKLHSQSIIIVCQFIIHVLTVNHSDEEHVEGKSVSGSVLFDGQIQGSVNNHNVQSLNMETSQLLSSAMPVICPTVNQALKQAPLLSCPTCGVQHKAGSPM